MRTRRVFGALGTALVLLAAPGCGSAAEPPADAVAWVDSVCGSLESFTEVTSTAPAIDQADPVAAVDGLRTYVEATGPTLEQALEELATVGTAPVEGGDALVAQLTDRIGRYRDGFAAARAELATSEAAEADRAEAVLPAALEPLRALSTLPAPTVALDPDTPLGRAAQDAASCRAIRTAES